MMIDLSGTALHKRGYRAEAGDAPLRETLAAALALISRPREEVLLWDPFCGLGYHSDRGGYDNDPSRTRHLAQLLLGGVSDVSAAAVA